MIPYELQHITLSQIEIFFRCAEMKNFTRAAESLLFTPGMVSKKIAALEEELGFALFVREKNRVSLTPEGEALYAAWRPPAEKMVRAAAEIRSRAARSSVVSVVIWGGANLERFFVPLLSACTADTELSFRIRLSDEIGFLEDLSTGRADVVIVPKFMELGLWGREELNWFLALPSPLYVALSPDNPLARKGSLQVEDLRGLDLCATADIVPWYLEMLHALCREHGFLPRMKYMDTESFQTGYLHLDAKSALIVDKYYTAFASSAAEYRELEGTESGLLLICRKLSPPHVQAFVEYARSFYRDLR